MYNFTMESQGFDKFQDIPFGIIAVKLLIATGIGMLIGMERRWSRKDFGIRSFTIVAILGVLSIQISQAMAIASLIGVFLLIIFAAIKNIYNNEHNELTTYVVLIATFILGVLLGLGHTFTPVAAALIIAMLLAWKFELNKFVGGLEPQEIRSAILLGLLAFVIFPLLPDRYIDKWKMINPSDIWASMVAIAGIGFINYVLLKVCRNKGLFLGAIFGGLVNSTATITEMTSRLKDLNQSNKITGYSSIINIAMFLRNMVLCALFVPLSITSTLIPLILMSLVAGYWIWREKKTLFDAKINPQVEIKLSSPLSLKKVISFGVFYVLIQVGGVVLTYFFGKNGMLITGAIGGLISSASTTVSAATMAMHHQISPTMAGMTAIVSSITSAVVDLPIVWKIIQDRKIVLSFTFKLIYHAVFQHVLIRQ